MCVCVFFFLHIELNSGFHKDPQFLENKTTAGLFEGGLRSPGASTKFELVYESVKSKFSLILFAYNLII